MDTHIRPLERSRGDVDLRGSRCARRERGAVAVEFAIIMPILLLLVLGIIEFGFGYHAWDSTQNAAREGARLGAVQPDASAIELRTINAASLLNEDQLVVTVQCGVSGGIFGTCPAAGADGWKTENLIVRVTVDYAYDFLTPLPNFVGLGGQMEMKSVSEARFEGL